MTHRSGWNWKGERTLTFTKLDARQPLWIRDARGNLVMHTSHRKSHTTGQRHAHRRRYPARHSRQSAVQHSMDAESAGHQRCGGTPCWRGRQPIPENRRTPALQSAYFASNTTRSPPMKHCSVDSDESRLIEHSTIATTGTNRPNGIVTDASGLRNAQTLN